MSQDTNNEKKPKVAMYWTASCGGCECSVVDIGEPILDVASKVEFVLWPVAMDFKYHNIEALEDGEIDLCLFNGAIRSSEQEYFAKLLRRKSKILVAFGACAHMGGIPGLSDFSTKEATLKTVYKDLNTVKNETVVPKTKVDVPEGELELPELYDEVFRLQDIVDVDCYLPGCPPTSEQIAEFIYEILDGKVPEKGAVWGLKKNLCDECERERKEKKIKKFYRPHEKLADPKECLLDQGFFCMGPVTRAGCKSQCISANMPCRGCYGPTDKTDDMGGAFISTIASAIDSNDPEEIRNILAEIPDIAGTVYRFALPSFIIKKDKKNKTEGQD